MSIAVPGLSAAPLLPTERNPTDAPGVPLHPC